MALSMLAACLSFMIPDGHSARPGVIAFWIFVFIFFYSWGQGPVPFAYSSEIFPLYNREQGMSFAVFINLFFAGLLTLFVPQMTTALRYGSSSVGPGQSRLLAVFAGLNVVSFLLIFFFVPETAGAALQGRQEGSLNNISLEELNYIFGVSTRKHIRYQLQHVLPWSVQWVKYGINRYVLRHKDAVEPEETEDLYYWVSVKKLEREARQQSALNQSEMDEAEEGFDSDDEGIAPDQTA
jgi:Sugar (and other) transporter